MDEIVHEGSKEESQLQWGKLKSEESGRCEISLVESAGTQRPSEEPSKQAFIDRYKKELVFQLQLQEQADKHHLGTSLRLASDVEA
jgi:hypothetical protein